MFRLRSMGIVAAALMALTTILVGFAHRPITLEPRGYGFDVAFYVLPDGTLPELCHTDDAGGHAAIEHHPEAGQGACDACLLSGVPGLGAVAEIVAPEPLFGGEIRNLVVDLVCDGSAIFSPVSRGPPLV